MFGEPGFAAKSGGLTSRISLIKITIAVNDYDYGLLSAKAWNTAPAQIPSYPPT